MYRRILRFVWRVLTAILVVGLATLTTFVIFPYLDRRLPVFPSVLLAYVILAYGLLPLASRFWRVVFQPNHIPLYTVTGDGWPADPVNIAVVAKNKRHLTKVMAVAGWKKADKRTFRNSLRLFISYVANLEYPTAPFTSLYLFGRTFDIGFQKQRGDSASPRTRHHVRFWQLDIRAYTDPDEHFHFWKQLLRGITRQHKTIWIGAAIDDNKPIGVHWRNLQFTHGNDTDTNKERDLIIADLQSADLVRALRTIQAGAPHSFYGQIIGNKFICDGQIKVVTLRRGLLARAANDEVNTSLHRRLQ